ncbi:MAG: hypothetical protein JEY71_12495 [Sphaerochaeta sp.]|nr:hypothetical protein [Sphaerochaeta sp.]
MVRKDGDLEFDFPQLYGRKMEMRDYFDLVVDDALVESIPLRTGVISTSWENAQKILVEVELFFPLTHQVGIRDFSCDESIQAPLRPRLASLSGLEVIIRALWARCSILISCRT